LKKAGDREIINALENNKSTMDFIDNTVAATSGVVDLPVMAAALSPGFRRHLIPALNDIRFLTDGFSGQLGRSLKIAMVRG
jgi:hypothetical protein